MMITIDGAAGEGGGQVLRTALSLSLVTGQPFRIENIRGGRERPGLMRQHVTSVAAAAAIGNTATTATVGGADLTFAPAGVNAGEYRFAIGTAGSTGLVLQTVLLPLVLADGPSRLVLEGGTHNPNAPPFDFLARTFLPLLNRMGPQVSAKLVRSGFYPAGGGRIEVEIVPAARLSPVEMTDRGAARGVKASGIVAGLPLDIARRELEAANKMLNWAVEDTDTFCLPGSEGPGNVLFLEARFAQVTEIVTGFGMHGRSAEYIGKTAGRRMAGYLASGAFAGPYLADQLLQPLALAGGGRFNTVKPSQHARTAADIIALFLPVRTAFEEQEGGTFLVTVSGAPLSPPV